MHFERRARLALSEKALKVFDYETDKAKEFFSSKTVVLPVRRLALELRRSTPWVELNISHWISSQ